MKLPREHLVHVAHSKTFHATHDVVHVAYFIAIMAEGRGFHSVVCGVLAVFTVIGAFAKDDLE